MLIKSAISLQVFPTTSRQPLVRCSWPWPTFSATLFFFFMTLTRRTKCANPHVRTYREYGLFAIDLQRLTGDVAGVRVRKLKSRLVVALVKAKRGTYGRPSPWTKLQAAPVTPSD